MRCQFVWGLVATQRGGGRCFYARRFLISNAAIRASVSFRLLANLRSAISVFLDSLRAARPADPALPKSPVLINVRPA